MFEALLARLATELKRADIRYMVIRGQAVQLYGEPGMTRDIDYGERQPEANSRRKL